MIFLEIYASELELFITSSEDTAIPDHAASDGVSE